MPIVKVWNDNSYDYKETFREQKIEIPAKGFIKMEQDEAELFKGTFAGILLDADSNPDPRGFKMIRIEPIGAEKAEDAPEKFVSHRDGQVFDTKAELLNHLKQFENEVIVDEQAEKEMTQKRGPGRPKSKGAA